MHLVRDVSEIKKCNQEKKKQSARAQKFLVKLFLSTDCLVPTDFAVSKINGTNLNRNGSSGVVLFL